MRAAKDMVKFDLGITTPRAAWIGSMAAMGTTGLGRWHRWGQRRLNDRNTVSSQSSPCSAPVVSTPNEIHDRRNPALTTARWDISRESQTLDHTLRAFWLGTPLALHRPCLRRPTSAC